MDGVLSSPEGKPALADLNNFATGGVSLRRIHMQEQLKNQHGNYCNQLNSIEFYQCLGFLK